ncbi:phosphotransferase [Actinoplanes sp. NPDC049118]|uniref:phosphotransferase enzyme family protein n=1 Tax=Actinoplanes sp. NPDC049118 TaxID=3155769 RepID=UPI00340FAD18
MLDEPDGLETAELLAGLADGWGIQARSVRYRPVGFGSYHWTTDEHFLTVDRLDDDRAFASLGRALDTALALHRAGLEFVVAPLPTRTGSAVLRLGPRYALSVYPLVDGDAGHFGAHRPEDVPEVLRILAELHRAERPVTAERAGLALPGRAGLIGLGRPWTGGPYAGQAWQLLSDHAARLGEMLAEYDGLVAQVEATAERWVVTHGEPHPGNLMRTGAGLVLIDWETVRIAPPERDLWMVTGDSGDPAAAALYRLRWKLADIAAYAGELRRPHQATEDITASWTYLKGYFA